MIKLMKPATLTIEQLSAIDYPVYASFKLDGIRCIVDNGVAYYSSGRKIDNRHIRTTLGNVAQDAVLDGELIVGNSFRDTTSAVRSRVGTPDFVYAVFDIINSDNWFDRQVKLAKYPIRIVRVTRCDSEYHVRERLRIALDEGYEGLVLNNPSAYYKHGRCTLQDNIAYKIKPFLDDEAVITGFEPLVAGGYKTKKLLGNLIVEHPTFGSFRIGSGFTDAERAKFWTYQNKYMNRIVKFKYQAVGNYNKPRTPIYLGLRSPKDI